MATGDTVDLAPIFEQSGDDARLSSQLFEARLLAFVRTLSARHRLARIESGGAIYRVGEGDRKLYFLEEGTVKVGVTTYGGQSCLLELHRAPAVFGLEACALAVRVDTAVADTPVSVRKIPVLDLMEAIKAEDLGSELMSYVAARGAQRQRVVTDFVACLSQERLTAALLRGRNPGQQDTRQVVVGQPRSPARSDIVATIRSPLRDRAGGDSDAVREQSSGTYEVAPASLRHGPLELDLVNQTLLVHGQAAETTRYQFMMLAHMVANAGRAISADEFRLQLFRSQHERSSSNVRRQIHALRQRLDKVQPGLAELIENVPGVGYGVGVHSPLAHKTAR